MTPDEIVASALSGGELSADAGQILWSATTADWPVQNLRPLLRSDNTRAVALGAYVAYELHWQARPLIPELTSLLSYPEPQVRFDAAYALTFCTTEDDAETLGQVLLLLADECSFVQRAAVLFIQHSDRRILNIAMTQAARRRPECGLSECLRLFGKYRPDHKPIRRAQVEWALASENQVIRMFGLGLAVRPRLVIDTCFLDLASKSDDAVVSEHAEAVRKFYRPSEAVVARLER